MLIVSGSWKDTACGARKAIKDTQVSSSSWPRRTLKQAPDAMLRTSTSVGESLRKSCPSAAKCAGGGGFAPLAMPSHLPESTPHVLATPSSPVVTIDLSSGVNAAHTTAPVWPSKVRTQLPFLIFQTLAVPSSLAVTAMVTSDEKAAYVTGPLCPSRVHASVAVPIMPSTTHTLAVQSAEAVMTHFKSDVAHAEMIAASCPPMVTSHTPCVAFQILAVPSLEHVSTAGHISTEIFAPTSQKEASSSSSSSEGTCRSTRTRGQRGSLAIRPTFLANSKTVLPAVVCTCASTSGEGHSNVETTISRARCSARRAAAAAALFSASFLARSSASACNRCRSSSSRSRRLRSSSSCFRSRCRCCSASASSHFSRCSSVNTLATTAPLRWPLTADGSARGTSPKKPVGRRMAE
mmetsp:Transcript_46664/g.134396  ORF Transcript_46664/g.134396 Transcript_46664/m.134396 type:complete len:407 (-) Transcript_46664:1760-2980(-)